MIHTSLSEDPRPRASGLLPVALAATTAALACALTVSVIGANDPGAAPLTTDGRPVGQLAGLTLLAAAASGVLAVVLRAIARLPLTHHATRARLGDLEHALREARAETSAAVQGRSDLAATLSHEIRTPLHALLGTTELLTSSGLEPAQREQIDRVRRSGTLVLGLVDDLLDQAGAEAGRLVVRAQPLELADVLADVVELLQPDADAKGVRLQTELDPGCPEWVRGDAPRLRRVLINLLGHAITSTDAGTVTVEICRAARSTQPTAVYFQVTDTGAGIPGDQPGRLSLPYSRVQRTDLRASEGTGLGLSTSQALVRTMGGEIVVTSQEGVGSVFGFELALPPEPAPVTTATALRGRRVAVLDRQPARAEQCATQLRRWGAEVELGLPQQLGWTGPTDLVVVREDHPDALTDLGHRVLRSATGRAPLLLLTASAHAAPAWSLAVRDCTMDAATVGSRLRGALVSLTLPPAGPPASAAAAAPPLRILLAEDDATCRQVCAMLLSRMGHDVDVVADGAAAVRAAASTTYDLVLMDSQMPELDGADATRAIRAAEPSQRQVRVLALTGAVRQADQRAFALAGMDGILTKPVNGARLAQALAEVPRRSGAASASGVPV